ncbi:RND superfamily resistance-nodulation-cell division acriflavin:proton (H+) antiporter [Cohnella kolymensis]|uniref:RND superfamily resistance-nodulation-cell division acriflavin:proton (H+) antiporter n=1 Tax=Cohnella kolymensis TaxID=1590652 RepID=A0ABR5A5G4_9BACL|nr:efflux RND transporter permease subunit [Cohnella kolymensis]KIL36300.1 RND superfamily resistance-nodulation-cell division acriflavin:proton (H+) antiporter [Cohnella kolymensis]
MKFFTNFSLRNPVAIVLLVILVAAGGLYAATQLKQEQQPEVAFPGVMVSSVYPGAAPNEVLNQVTLPLEKVLRNVEGVKNVTSQSANSVSMLQLEFAFNDDMKKKQEEVKQAIADVQLPQEVEKPKVQYFSTTNQPIMYTTVTAQKDLSVEQLTTIVKNSVVPDLQTIEGVTDVQVAGMKDDGVYIRLDAAKMAEKGISYDQVMGALQANNLSVPLGEATVDHNNLPVFVQGDLRSLEQLKQWNLTPAGDVKLTDIAQIEQGKDLSVINLTNGKPSITLNIVKSGTANTVEVSDKVLQVYEDAEKSGEIKTMIMYNRATDVKDSVSTLAREGGLGALFASILILFFLRNFRATLIAIVSIPLSMLIAMICLNYFTDVTLNIMTLGGLAVATGRVVDDSIVVIENLVRRMRGEKMSKDLILSATAEVGRAITSSTITTVAVFAPLGLLSGMIGGYFRPFAWTVAFALLSSLLVALTVVPLMAWALMKNAKPKEEKESAMSRGYKRVLRWSLGHKAVVLVLAMLLFVGSLVPMFAGAVGVTLLPETDYKYMFATLKMPKGTSLDVLQSEADKMDVVIREHHNVHNTSLTLGGSITGGGDSSTAEWFIGLTSDTDLDQFTDEVGKKVKVPQDAEFSLIKDDMAGGGAISVTVTGSSAADIRIATEQITDTISKVKGTSNVSNNLQHGTKGIAIEVRQSDALKNGLSAAQASFMLRPFLTETKAGRIGDGSKASDLYLALNGVSIASVDDIANLKLQTPLGKNIQVRDIADVKEVQLPSTVQFKNGSEFATVSGKITEKNAGKVNTDIENALKELKLPAGVEYSFGGSNADIQQMITDMMMAMMIAVGMVYIVMVIAFREGRAPLAVLFSLPFALIGGLVGTMAAGEPISVSSMIGFLMLIGIVVTNAIVLVERVQQQIEHGVSIREALIEAGGTRLRPILMTAIATICALIPLAIGLGGGSIISSGLAVVVIGGLASSTLLTLVVVPVMYELLYFKRSRKQRMASKPVTAEAAA